MSMPLRQSLRIGTYLMRQKLARNDKFPLLVELEPLFACNLKCAGCGKIQQPHDVLKQRMPVEQALAAIEECGAPMVSIAGGEPLMHPQIDVLVAELIKRKKFVFLCTNALLIPQEDRQVQAVAVLRLGGAHRRAEGAARRVGLQGRRVRRGGRRDQGAASGAGSRSTPTPRSSTPTPRRPSSTCSATSTTTSAWTRCMISPAYAYEKAPDQDHFLGVNETTELFRKAFADGNRRRWRLNHTPLFLDFLEGKTDFGCTAWGIPSYSLLGWQRPCYLMSDGYVKTYKELIETTDWDAYGRGKDPRCANCMAHCGYEPSAVLATMGSLKESLRAMRGS